MLVRQQQFFKPIDDMLDGLLVTGLVEAMQGRPIVRLDADTQAVYADQALTETANWIGRWCSVNRRNVDVEPLRRLAAKLRDSMPVEQADVHKAKAAVDGLRRLVLTMTEADRRGLDLTRQIENELEAIHA